MTKPIVYRCACAVVFKPTHWPYMRRCGCGVVITVNKPMKEPAK